MVGKGVAVIFALCLLGGYVWFSQSRAKPNTVPVSGSVVLPEAPAHPHVFSTTKSGPVHMTPGVGSLVEKKLAVRSFLIDSENQEEPPGVTIETPTDIIVSSKAINMPLFSTRKSAGEDGEPEGLASEGDPFATTETEGSGVTIETPTGISLGSKSISMPVFKVKPAENIVPWKPIETEEKPLLHSTKYYSPVVGTKALQEIVDRWEKPNVASEEPSGGRVSKEAEAEEQPEVGAAADKDS